MKALILAIITLTLIILASYTSISYESDPYTLKTFVIDGNKENTQINYHSLNKFIIGHKPSGREMLLQTYKQTQAARKRNIMYQQRDEEIEKCIKKITKNWRRTYYKESYEKVYDNQLKLWNTTNVFWEKEKEFYGYDEDEDWDLRWRLRNRALDGKKIC